MTRHQEWRSVLFFFLNLQFSDMVCCRRIAWLLIPLVSPCMIAKLQWSNGVGRRRYNETKNASPTSLVILVSIFVASWNATAPRICLEFLEPHAWKECVHYFRFPMQKRRGKNMERERERERERAQSKTRRYWREEQNQKLGRERLELSTSGFLVSYETYALANCATTPSCYC